MTFRSSLLLVVTITLVFVSTAVADQKDADAAALVENAKHLSDIRAEGAPPFRLKMDYKIIPEHGAVLEGTYMEVWVSKGQSRRETKLGDFHRTQVAAGKKKWLLDSNRIAPEHLDDARRLLEFARFQPQEWKSPKDRELNGVSVRCVKSKLPGVSWVLCFDKSSGTLSTETRTFEFGGRVGERICVYSDYQKFGDRSLPRSYECHEGKNPRVQARIVELTADPSPDEALFTPLVGGKESMNCLGSTKPPTVVYSPSPRLVQTSGSSTLVVMSAIVDVNGQSHDLRIISSPSDDLAKAALDALRQWKFKPATCDGEPIESEIAVETESHVK